MTAVVTHDSARLRRLRSLRLEVDQAIAEEEARLDRLARLPRKPTAEQRRETAVAAIEARLDPTTVRAWARSKGLPVAQRGRVSAALYRACAEARYQERGSSV